MERQRPAVMVALLPASLLLACGDSGHRVRTDPLEPSLEIVDAVHQAGNPHFFFLPPLVPAAPTNGPFDGSQSPTVRICVSNGSDCVGTDLARYTTATGPGSETVRASLTDEQYVVNWHTNEFALDPSKTYRIVVQLQERELGHADVDVVETGGQVRNVQTDDYIPLVDGRTLPIKFRIEEGALPPVTPQWVQLLPTGTLPAIRGGHTAVLDAGSNRLMVFGGRAAGSLVSDVWILTYANGTGGSPAWTKANPVGGQPPARLGHTAVFDPTSNRMIVFGGSTEGARLNDVWVLTNANGTEASPPAWTQLVPSGAAPTPRVNPAGAYDPASNRLIIFGGEGPFGWAPPNVFGDVWVLTNANGLGGTPAWIQLATTGSPPLPRSEAVTAFDAGTSRLVLFGGTYGGCAPLNDVWTLSNGNGIGGPPIWSLVAPQGASPDGRFIPSVGYRSAGGRLIVYGGGGGYPCLPLFQDAWVLEGATGTTPATWTQLYPTGGPPPIRLAYTTDAYDPITNRLILFGGQTGANPTGGSEFLNDVWVLTNADGRP